MPGKADPPLPGDGVRTMLGADRATKPISQPHMTALLALATDPSYILARPGPGIDEVIAAMPPLRRTLFRGVWHTRRRPRGAENQ